MNELSIEQQNILETLSDPSHEDEFPHNWERDFQRDILSSLLSDRYFLIQSIDLIEPFYFTDEVHKHICDKLFKYFREYSEIPKKVYMRHEMSEIVDNSTMCMAHAVELNLLYDCYVPGLKDRDYLTDRIYNFAQSQQLKTAFNRSLGFMKQYGTNDDTAWAKIKDTLHEALLFEKNFDEGVDYFGSFKERYERMMSEEAKKDRFITGISEVDRNIKGGGLSRGELGAVIAPSGVGKSLFLANVAVNNVRRNKKVLYLSLEMKEDKVAERIDAMLTQIPINELYYKKEQVFEQLENFKEEYGKNLRVKEFPASAADINTFRAYIAQLRLRGFLPDLVIVDYVGEMKDYSGIQVYESREKLVRDLRRLASEENVCVFTALQPNRSGKAAAKEGYIDDEHFGDSQGQIRPMDACWSLNQDEVEEKIGLLRLWAIKHRDGKSRFWAYIRKDHSNLIFTEIDKRAYADLKNEYKQVKAIENSDTLGAKEFDTNDFRLSEEMKKLETEAPARLERLDKTLKKSAEDYEKVVQSIHEGAKLSTKMQSAIGDNDDT